MGAKTVSALDLARKVLRTEAAAILSLVDRIDGEFERAVQVLSAAAQLQGARDPHRHGQVGDHLPQDCRDADEYRHVSLVPASR